MLLLSEIHVETLGTIVDAINDLVESLLISMGFFFSIGSGSYMCFTAQIGFITAVCIKHKGEKKSGLYDSVCLLLFNMLIADRDLYCFV